MALPSESRARAIGTSLRPVAAAGALVVLLAHQWAGLWREPQRGALLAAVLVGVAPALVRVLPVPRARLSASVAGLAAVVLVVLAAVGANLKELVAGDSAVWGRIGDILPEGLGNAARTGLPLAATGTEALSSLLVVVLAAGSALVMWQLVVARRPLTAIIAATIGLSYRWTLVPPEQPVLVGLVTVAVALVALRFGPGGRGLSGRAPARAVVAGALVVGVAALAGIGAARDSAPWWNWKSWTFGADRTQTTLTLAQEYGPLSYPEKPVVLARLKADRAMPLRAVAYERFDGSRFAEATPGTRPRRVTGTVDSLDPGIAGVEAESENVEVSIVKTRTPYIFFPGRPTEVANIGERDVFVLDDGTLRVDPSIGPNLTYRVTTSLPDPGVERLLEITGYDEPLDSELFEILPGSGRQTVIVPPFGSGQSLPPPEAYGPYEGVARLARQVVGNARTPYAAANRIETFLRDVDEFSYNEKAPAAPAGPELAHFLLNSRQGYCQQFAGSMALMLRMSGIPARVAVGLSVGSGRFDSASGTYTIVDRDAHSWVEVYFPRYGWLPFDPTLGRSAPNSASVSSPEYSLPSSVTEIDPNLSSEPVAPTPREVREPDSPAAEPVSDAPVDGGLSVPAILGFGLAGLVMLGLIPAAAKGARRLRRRRGGERAAVLGAARELEALMLDAGHGVDPTATPTERAQRLYRELGVNSEAIYGLAAEARFSSTGPPPGSGVTAWRHFARARRALGWRKRLRAGIRLRSLRRR